MNDLIKTQNGDYLTPLQIHSIILSNGQILGIEDEYLLKVEIKEGELTHVLESRVHRGVVPGLTQEQLKSLLGDAIFREYTIKYHSSKRLEKQQ